MTEMPQTVCIVGLGLMGGSLALAWRQAGVTWRVVGVDRDTETLDAARAAGAIAQGTDRLAEGLADAGAVVIAIPVRGILRLLPEIGRLARAGTLVMDLGSTKAEICAAMEELPPGIDPVGGHPMCGTERAGFAAAQADLFREHPFVLCPLARTSPGALAKAQYLATASGGRPALADPAEHDAAVAAISHLPYVAAVALVQSIGGDGNALAWRLAASGFRDSTRVAAGSPEVMLDALLTNREAVVDCLATLCGELAELRAALEAGDETALHEYLAAAQARRAGWQAGEVASAGPITRLF